MRFSLAIALTVTAAGCASARASRAELERYREMRGTLVEAKAMPAGTRGRYSLYHVRFASTTGLRATGRLLVPPGTGPHPGVLLNDGRELDSRAVDYLPADFGDVVVLSLDYPAALPYELRLGTLLFRSGRLRRAAREIPALFSLGAEYLAARPDVDSTRIALAATSFAVPFATIAAAADDRFREVALIYGAGDMPSVLAANLRLQPRFLRRPVAELLMLPFAEFEPGRYIGRIAPRPVVMVNGSDDPQMPAAAVRALYDAAKHPKSLIWLRTGHLLPTDTALIRVLVDTALARLQVLEGASTATRASDAILESLDAGLARTVRAAEEHSVGLDTVPDYPTAAVRALGRERVNRALEGVERVGRTLHVDGECLIVVVAAHLASGHCPPRDVC